MARPVPKRLAGYNPAPREPGRGPTDVPTVPTETTPVFPPTVTEWLPPFIPPFDVPGIVVPPITPPTKPCDPKTDPECPVTPPPPPPDDVPEPATWLIFALGLLGVWRVFASRKT